MQNSSNDLFSRIFESSREFKKVTTITTCAMFGALAIVLGYYSFKITGRRLSLRRRDGRDQIHAETRRRLHARFYL